MLARSLALMLLGGLFLGFSGVSTARAQGGLSRNDRLLIYYYSFYAQQNSQRILKNQQKMQSELSRRFDAPRFQGPQATQYDAIDQYVREGRESQRPAVALPPIYSGRRDYFQRAPYFNPNQVPGR